MLRPSNRFVYIPAVILGLLTTSPAHAQVWTVANLHPAGASWSHVSRVSGGQQVGYAHFGDDLVDPSHAGLWRGTSQSWVDLSQAGWSFSSALDASEEHQVGWASFDLVARASLWSGIAASWEDLSVLLPRGAWGSTGAGGVWREGTTTYVIGTGFSLDTNRADALLYWRRNGQ